MSYTPKLLAGGAAVLIFSVASTGLAFGRPAAHVKKTTITWWSWTTNAKNEVAAFEKTHPYIHVNYTQTAGATEYS